MPTAHDAAALTNPIATFQPQGRDTRTYQFIDTATYVTGDHTLQFGGSYQRVKVNPYNYAGRFPTITFGFSAAAPAGGAARGDAVPRAASAPTTWPPPTRTWPTSPASSRRWRRRSRSQDTTSGFVAGIPDEPQLHVQQHATSTSRTTGARSPASPSGAASSGSTSARCARTTTCSCCRCRTAGQSTIDALLEPGRHRRLRQRRDVRRRQEQLRADHRLRLGSVARTAGPRCAAPTRWRSSTRRRSPSRATPRSATRASRTAAALTNQYAALGDGAPVDPDAGLQVPRTYAQQIGLSLTSAAFGIDSEITQPQVHQFNLSVEREIGFDMAVEARYVGTLGRGIWRGVDYNQVSSRGPVPRRLPAGAAERLPGAGGATGLQPGLQPGHRRQPAADLHHAVRRRLADQRDGPQQHPDRPGRRARRLLPVVAGAAVAAQARAAFYGNSGIYAADNIINGASTDYHALQIETRRRFKNGIFWQANYTFSKSLPDSTGTAQARFEPFIDNARPGIERTRAEFHVTHVLNANAIWELPFGEGRRWLDQGGVLNALAGGWQLSGIVHWQSGIPFSITAARGTFNRGGRSANNMAVTDADARRDPGAHRHLQAAGRARLLHRPEGDRSGDRPRRRHRHAGQRRRLPRPGVLQPGGRRDRHAAAPVARRAVDLPAGPEPRASGSGSAAATRRSSRSRRSTCSTRRSSISRTRTSTARRSGASRSSNRTRRGRACCSSRVKFNF